MPEIAKCLTSLTLIDYPSKSSSQVRLNRKAAWIQDRRYFFSFRFTMASFSRAENRDRRWLGETEREEQGGLFEYDGKVFF